MAILLIIVAIITQAAGATLLHQHHHQAFRANEQKLIDIQQGLLQFFSYYQYLPCPDTDGNGHENRNDQGACSQTQGRLPHLTLDNLHAQDAYGNPFFYAINTEADNNNLRDPCTAASLFAQKGHASYSIYQCPTTQQTYCSSSYCNAACTNTCSPKTIEKHQPPYFMRITPPLANQNALLGNLRLCRQHAEQCDLNTQNSHHRANQIPLIVISYGSEGHQIWQSCHQAPAQAQQNCNGNRYFHDFDPQHPGTHQFTWLDLYQLKAKLKPPN